MLRKLIPDVREIYRLVTDPELSLAYYPDEPRKTSPRILADLLYWRLKHGEVNRYYYCWGMDRVNGPRARDLLSYREFKRLRDGRNQRGHVAGLNYIPLLRDKYLFGVLLDALGYPTPAVLALVEADTVEWLRPRRTSPHESLLHVEPELDAFYKPRYGIGGQGVFSVRVADGTLLLDGAEATVREFSARVRDGVLQQRLVQHELLAELHPRSVNTLRLITVRDRAGCRPFSRPLLRIGFGGSVVDNGSAGGIQVFVDAATGRLTGPGLLLKGGTVSRHPDSGIAIDGFEIPYFEEARDLAVRLHREVPGLHTIGWDLAMTPTGPAFLEGNDNWAAGLRLGLEPNFKREFETLCARS